MRDQVFKVLTGEMVDSLRGVLKLQEGATVDQIKEKILSGEMGDNPEVRKILSDAMTDNVFSHRKFNNVKADKHIQAKTSKTIQLN